MPNAIMLIFRQMKAIWAQFGVNQKTSLVLACLVVAGVFAGVLYWSSRPSFALLYSGLRLEDAAAAREKLADEKIPVQLRDSGRSLLVPESDVYRARLLLASAGIPKQSAAGLELFEQPRFGLTDFAQRVNYQRALQGELERTISSMDGVEWARVMLVLPTERLFAGPSEKKASGSVMVGLVAGGTLSGVQVRSIRHLVASAVPGLSARSVTVADQTGRLLSQRAEEEEESPVGAASDQVDIQERVEKLLTHKAQSLLDAALGPGQSIVRVHAVLDFSRVEKRSEKFDAEGRVVASEKISSESASGSLATGAGGPVGVTTVGNPANLVVEPSPPRSKKEDIATEYRIPSDVEHMVQQGVRVRDVSVSVCVARRATPREPAQIKALQDLVATAVGISQEADRARTVQVVELEFPAPPPAEKVPLWRQLPVAPTSLLNGAAAVAILLIIFLATRRVISRLAVHREEVGIPVSALAPGLAGRATPRPGAPLTTPGAAPVPLEAAADEVARLAEENPKAIATWITALSRKAT